MDTRPLLAYNFHVLYILNIIFQSLRSQSDHPFNYFQRWSFSNIDRVNALYHALIVS